MKLKHDERPQDYYNKQLSPKCLPYYRLVVTHDDVVDVTFFINSCILLLRVF